MNIQRLLIASLLSTTVVMDGCSDSSHFDLPSSIAVTGGDSNASNLEKLQDIRAEIDKRTENIKKIEKEIEKSKLDRDRKIKEVKQEFDRIINPQMDACNKIQTDADNALQQSAMLKEENPKESQRLYEESCMKHKEASDKNYEISEIMRELCYKKIHK
ncbi:hypothetical protein Q7M63_04740 [Candidatus Liberibacter asiaticus]|uniref:hypothetical protein n=1 Tax=Liberibacter asiaticus TaxID=34021 RepID=UPI0006B8D10E|nr:hypothetical protein [Candidatus Liberibacter asiaticus]ASK53084.1 hypothetical protein B2I23_04805 [Candidatus Liberibacter asiaticus]KAE9514933.1 hypothetical protein FXW26_05430 [Candidatus Liberibacter asiaticus]KAE9516139.1 hypothetical protein FXW27_04585 [Candidatus Liberibacter asiaticus]KPG63221.1 hypothetical protein AL011_04715 [Candidatus Liberibacter asiaticus]